MKENSKFYFRKTLSAGIKSLVFSLSFSYNENI